MPPRNYTTARERALENKVKKIRVLMVEARSTTSRFVVDRDFLRELDKVLDG